MADIDKTKEINLGGLIARVYRDDSRKIFATLVRLLNDFDLAEDALHEAFRAAIENWPKTGVPSNPIAWLVSTGRFKAIDAIRRRARFESLTDQAEEILSSAESNPKDFEPEVVGDEVLRVIFTCCHPALAPESQVALTLREVCELATEEIAHAFLVPAPTLAQRIVRAKAKIREARLPFELPEARELEDRLQSVLRVIYLVFNEGYYASSGNSVTASDLSREAIRLGELLAGLLPHAEVFGLNALMLFSESRRKVREKDGEIVLLEDQDRTRWDHALISTGNRYLQQAVTMGPPEPYTIQAMIAAQHANAASSSATNWTQIVILYDQLGGLTPSPVIRLNRAVAVAMAGAIEVALQEIDELIDSGALAAYGLAHAARADLLRRQGAYEAAKLAYCEALELAQMEPERRFLSMRIREVELKSRS